MAGDCEPNRERIKSIGPCGIKPSRPLRPFGIGKMKSLPGRIWSPLVVINLFCVGLGLWEKLLNWEGLGPPLSFPGSFSRKGTRHLHQSIYRGNLKRIRPIQFFCAPIYLLFDLGPGFIIPTRSGKDRLRLVPWLF